MTIKSPKPYESIIQASRMFLSSEDIQEYSSELPDSSYPSESLATNNVTTIGNDTLSGVFTSTTYRIYRYKTILLTTDFNEVLAVINLDNMQEIKSRSLTIRIQITNQDLGQGILNARIASDPFLSSKNPYHKPIELIDVVTDKSTAFLMNQGQPVYRNMQVNLDKNLFNAFSGIPRLNSIKYSQDLDISHVLPFNIGRNPYVEIRTTGGLIILLDLLNRVLFTNDAVPGFKLDSYASNSFNTYTWRYGGMTNLGDLFGLTSVIPNIDEGVPFQGLGTTNDMYLVSQNPELIIGADFNEINLWLGEDCRGLLVERFLTPKYSIFINSNKSRLIVVDIENQYVGAFSLVTNELFYTEGGLVFYPDYRLKLENGTVSEEYQIHSYIQLMDLIPYQELILNTASKDNIHLNFFNQFYLLTYGGRTLSNIIL